MGRSEKSILNETLVDVSSLPDTLVYRNNTGKAWQGSRLDVTPGQTVMVQPGMVILAAARFITFGLPGSGDIMGASRGRPVSVEMKTETGPQRELQKNFERAWVKAGGLYILARSADEAVLGLSI